MGLGSRVCCGSGPCSRLPAPGMATGPTALLLPLTSLVWFYNLPPEGLNQLLSLTSGYVSWHQSSWSSAATLLTQHWYCPSFSGLVVEQDSPRAGGAGAGKSMWHRRGMSPGVWLSVRAQRSGEE